MSQNPNPSTDNFDDIEAKAELERKEAEYPKNSDGSVDVDSLTPDQAATYWKDRHDASTRGFHSFKSKVDKTLSEKEQEIERLKLSPNPTPTKTEIESAAHTAETLADFEKAIPNFDLLDEEAQNNLRAIFNAMEQRVSSVLRNDPGVAFARQTFNEQKWDKAFEAIAPQFGEDLASKKADFKSKYYQPNNVPDNIGEILTQLAKSYLFDTVRERGAEDERAKADRLALERANGGVKTPPSNGMSIDDWERLRKTNPRAFAARASEYNAQMNAGQLQE